MRATKLFLAIFLLASAVAWFLATNVAPERPNRSSEVLFVVEDGTAVEKRFAARDKLTEWKAPASVYFELVELALLRGAWSEAAEYASDAIERDPAAPQAEGARIAAAFFPALVENDRHLAVSAYQEAHALLRDRPDDRLASLVVVHWYLREGSGEEALPLIDAAITREPLFYEYDELRLAALKLIGDEDRVGDQISTMHRKHPARTEVTEWLVQWMIGQGRILEASATLFDETQRAVPSDGPISTHVAFLREQMGDESAAAEIERLLKVRPAIAGAEMYQSALAEIEFALGRVPQAIGRLGGVVQGNGPPPVRADATLKMALMLEESGEGARARLEIDELLRWNEANTEARKMRAEWLIESGDAEMAIEDLRAADSQSPRDPRIALLLGEAYLMQGSDALASEQFALAFEYSDSGAAEAARFTDFLVSRDQLELAGHVLTVALTDHEDDLGLLERAIQVYLAQGDTIRSKELAGRLRELGGFTGDMRDVTRP